MRIPQEDLETIRATSDEERVPISGLLKSKFVAR